MIGWSCLMNQWWTGFLPVLCFNEPSKFLQQVSISCCSRCIL